MQRLSNLTRDALDASNRLDIQFLRRELDGSIARMDTCKLDVLGDSIGQNLAILGHSVHLNLLGMLDELRHDNGMILRHVGRQLEETLQLVFVRADIHRCTREYIGRTHQNGESHPIDKGIDVLHRGQRTPFGLVDTQLVKHLRELRTVLCAIDILSGSSQNGHMLLIEIDCQVVGYLAARRDDDTMGLFHIDDVQYALEGEFVEIQTVTHIVIRRYGLRIVVDHHRAPPLFADGIQRLDATPVELNGRTDAIGS